MTKAEKIIKELEAELDEYTKQSMSFDLDKVQDAKLVFMRMSFYNAQTNVKLFKRLDEIEAKIDKLDVKR